MPKRYSNLAPLAFEKRLEIALLALRFFGPGTFEENCRIIGKTRPAGIVPLSGGEFLTYLTKLQVLDKADRYMQQIREILLHLERANILAEAEKRATDPFLPSLYYFMKELTTRENRGNLWLAPALGPEFIQFKLQPYVVHIVGTDENGDARSGTGLIVAERCVLTCAHVLRDMTVAKIQMIFGKPVEIEEPLVHERVDVGLLRLQTDVPIMPELAFRDPAILETVFPMGYPRIPLARTTPLVMTHGEVTNAAVTAFDGSEIFLYSAIARPGNSGGPIVSLSGHVVGIVTQDLSDGEPSPKSASPFFAGVKTSILAAAMQEIAPTIQLPIEDYQ